MAGQLALLVVLLVLAIILTTTAALSFRSWTTTSRAGRAAEVHQAKPAPM
jgi:hypothetical protein